MPFFKFFRRRPKIQRDIINYSVEYGHNEVYFDYNDLAKKINRKLGTSHSPEKIEKNVEELREEGRVFIKENGSDAYKLIRSPIM